VNELENAEKLRVWKLTRRRRDEHDAVREREVNLATGNDMI
jgi:hypothetical protein